MMLRPPTRSSFSLAPATIARFADELQPPAKLGRRCADKGRARNRAGQSLTDTIAHAQLRFAAVAGLSPGARGTLPAARVLRLAVVACRCRLTSVGVFCVGHLGAIRAPAGARHGVTVYFGSAQLLHAAPGSGHRAQCARVASFASVAAVPRGVPIEAASQPPPRAWISATLATRRLWRMVSRLCASPRAIAWAVTTEVYATVPARYWLSVSCTERSADLTVCSWTSTCCSRMRSAASSSSTCWNAVSTVCR